MNFRPDDLIFDLEIRGNLFVVSQYYPNPDVNRLVVSYLESLPDNKTNTTTNQQNSTDNLANSNEQAIAESATKLAQSSTLNADQNRNPVLDPSANDDPANLDQDANFLDQQFQNNPPLFAQESQTNTTNHKTDSSTNLSDQSANDQPINWQSGILQDFAIDDENHYYIKPNQKALDRVTQLIRKTVTHYQDTDIVFENLADPNDFLKFAHRYGIVLNENDRHELGTYGVTFATDQRFDPDRDGLRIGYNSQNYDQTLIAHYLANMMSDIIRAGHFIHNHSNLSKTELITKLQQQGLDSLQHLMYQATVTGTGSGDLNSPRTLTDVNAQMFNEVNHPANDKRGYMNNILQWGTPEKATYNAWKISDRYVDVSNLNPKKISLKRCAMALGLKIEESSSNRDPNQDLKTVDEFADVIAYNANDVYVTMQVFQSDTYANRFAQNRQLLKEFPYLIYQQSPNAGKNGNPRIMATIDEDHVRFNRLTTNSTSRSFVDAVIAPYPNTKIKDNPTLNLNYPGPDVIKERLKDGTLPPLFHGKPRNMLDYIHDLLEDRFKREHISDDVANQVREQYQKIRNLYEPFIGKNFNNEMDPTEKNNNLTDAEKQQWEDTKDYNDRQLKLMRNARRLALQKINDFSDQQFEHAFGVPRPFHNAPLSPKHFSAAMINMINHLGASTVKQMKIGQTGVTFGDLVVFKSDGQVEQFDHLRKLTKSPYRKLSSTSSKRSIILPYITPHGVYRDRHGVDLRSYIVISIGGAHGLEVQYSPFHQDVKTYDQKEARRQKLIDYFNQLPADQWQAKYQTDQPNEPVTVDNLNLVIASLRPNDPFTHIKRAPLPTDSNATFGDILTKSASRRKPKLRQIKEVSLFDGSQVKKEYSYTSSNASNHEDFDSYYPSLISNLEIFKNVDGKDVFTEDLYHPRIHLKKIAKGKIKNKPDGTPYSESEIASAALRQLSMKLLINSASGGGDATFSSNIKCNNKMLAMRIIGQLFCWYIGQSLALHDARVPSTNTDGLYTMNIDEKLNNQLVKECADQLLLGIGPEYLPLFVSKDANNRLERSRYATVASARGGALTSWQGPSTDNTIAHPAIVDYVLAQYLARVDDAVNHEFQPDKAKKFFAEFLKNRPKFAKTDADILRFFQFPLVANPSTGRFSYLATPVTKTSLTGEKVTTWKTQYLNPTNRAFFVKPSVTKTTIKQTGLSVVQANTVKKRLNLKSTKDATDKPFSEIITQDPQARDIIIQNIGATAYNDQYLEKRFDPKATSTSDKPRDIKPVKISDFPENQPAMILNEDLHDLSHQEFLTWLNRLDFNVYLNIVQEKFEKQWLNHIA